MCKKRNGGGRNLIQRLHVGFVLPAIAAMNQLVVGATITNDLPAEFKRLSLIEWRALSQLALLEASIPAADAAGSNLVVVSHSNFMACLDVFTGQQRWRVEHDGRNPSVPFVGDGIAVVHSLDWREGDVTRVTVFDLKDGQQLWSEPATNGMSAPVFLKGRMYVASGDRLECFQSDSHEKKWERRYSGLRLTRDAVIAHDVIVGLASNSVVRIDGDTGDTEWRSVFQNTPTRISADGDQVYVYVYQDARLYCIAAKDGSVLWETETPCLTVPPKVAGHFVALLGQGHSYSHFHGLIVVRRDTGEPVWHAGGDADVQSAALSGEFLYYQRGNSIRVFDLRRGINCGYFVWDDVFNILQGSYESVLIISQTYGIVRFRPNINELRTFRDPALFYLDERGRQALFQIVVLLLAIVLLVAIGTGGKKTIPGTPDTAAQVFALWVVSICVIGVYVHAAWIVWILGGKQGFSSAHFVALAGFLGPVCILPLGYLLLGRAGVIYSHRSSTENVPARIRGLVADLQHNMGIAPPVILRAGRSGSSPAVYSGARNRFLVLPLDFDESALQAASKDEQRAYQLQRLIVAHELAHVKSGDTASLPMLWASRWLWLAACGGLIAWGWSALSGNLDISAVIRPVVVIGICVGLGCWFVSWVVASAKEKYADGLASTFVSPEVLQALADTRQSLRGVSILNQYLFLLGMKRPPLWTFSGQHTSIKSFTAAAAVRAKELQDKAQVVKVGDVLKPVLAVVAGLMAALVIKVADVEKLLMFYQFLVGKYGGIEQHWLNGISLWSDFYGAATTSVATAVAGILAVAVLLMPLRDSHRETDLVEMKIVGWALVLLLGATVIANVALSLISSITERGVLNFGVLGLQRSVSLMVMGGVSVGLWVSMLGRWARNLADVCLLFAEVMAGLIIALSVWALIIGLFDGIPVTSRILLAVASSMACGILVNLGLDTFVGRVKRYSGESITYCRLLSLRSTRISFDSLSDKGKLLLHSIMGSLFTLAIPTLLIAVIAYPELMRLDQWHMDSAGTVMETVHRTTSLPIDEIKQRGIGIWRDSWFGLAMTYFGGPGKLSASGVVLLLCATCLMALVLVTAIGKVGNQAEAKRQDTIEKTPLLVLLSEELGCNLITESWVSRYEVAIRKGFRRRRPYVKGVERVPMMAATCGAAMIPGSLKRIERKLALEWIEMCAARGGGFGYAHGQKPDVLHTYAALGALSKGGLLSPDDRDRHRMWLTEQARVLINEGMVNRPVEGLAKAYYILKGMACIHAMDSLSDDDGERMKQVCVGLWRRGVQDEYLTFFLTEVLGDLGVKGDALPEDITRRITLFEGRLRQMDPNHHLETLHKVVRMVHLAFPHDFLRRESVSVAKDNICKTYCRPAGLFASLISRWLQ